MLDIGVSMYEVVRTREPVYIFSFDMPSNPYALNSSYQNISFFRMLITFNLLSD